MPGSGKSTFGKKLAEAIDMNFFDLDEQIEKMTGVSIPKIFEDAGEDQFRMLETYVLGMLIKLDEPSMIATGGGTPCFYENMETMKEAGPTVFINTPIDTIIERVLAQKGQRPLVEDMPDDTVKEDMLRMYKNRLPEYEKADFTSDSNLEDIVAFLSSKS